MAEKPQFEFVRGRVLASFGELEQGVVREDSEEADGTNHMECVADVGRDLECTDAFQEGGRTREQTNTETEGAGTTIEYIIHFVVSAIVE